MGNVDVLVKNHWTLKAFRQRVTKDVLRQLLLDDKTVIRAGQLCRLKHQHVGVGVYEIWFESDADAKGNKQ